nr:long-chain fatty acid transporter [Rhizobium sp. Q54]
MTKKLVSKTLLALAAGCLLQTSALAGGWNRGEADTDILFEEGNIAGRAGVTYVSPHRQYSTINGADATDSRFSQDYWIPSFAAKFDASENFGCAFTYTQPFGADAEYGSQAQAASLAGGGTGASRKEFITNEYGATCDIRAQVGKGRLHFLGGVFLQDFEYEADAALGNLRLEDDAARGYRLGVAYDIPEYALRVQLMYRSKVDHDADEGTFDWGGPFAALGEQDAYGSGTLPQSLKLSIQTGVAPGWLVYGSVKWTDWSVMDSLNYSIYTPVALPLPPVGVPAGYIPREDVYNWRDGWTIQAGVGHAFTETVSGTVNLTWDRGVDTGADIYSDTWTVAAGVSIKAGPGELRLGGAVSYLTEGEQSTADEAVYNATADGDWAYAVSGSYRIAF